MTTTGEAVRVRRFARTAYGDWREAGFGCSPHPVRQEERSYPGFNLFSSADLDLFLALTRG